MWHMCEVLMMSFRPEVWFNIRVLKAVQMMEIPMLKSWIHSLVMDGLTQALVDPGKFDLHLDNAGPTYAPSQSRSKSKGTAIPIVLHVTHSTLLIAPSFCITNKFVFACEQDCFVYFGPNSLSLRDIQGITMFFQLPDWHQIVMVISMHHPQLQLLLIVHRKHVCTFIG